MCYDPDAISAMSDARSQSTALDARHKVLENIVVLHLTQAMLGLISQSLQAVAVDVAPERLVVHFAYSSDAPEHRDDVEDILADLDALLDNDDVPNDWKIEPLLHVGPVDESWPGLPFRRVFETKSARSESAGRP